MVANMVGVPTTTTFAEVTEVVGKGEKHRMLVSMTAPPRGQLWSNTGGSWPQLCRGQRRMEKRFERTFSAGRLVNLRPLVLVIEHGRPQRRGRGSKQEV